MIARVLGLSADQVDAERAVPLVGREVELDAARTVLGAGSRPAGILLTGGRGIGKSRLAEEILSLHGQDALDVDPALEDAWRTPRAPGVVEKAVARAVRLRLLVRVHNAHLLAADAVPVLVQAVCRNRVRLVAEVNTDADRTEAGDALWRSPCLHRIHVGPLDASSTRRLAGILSGQRLSQQSAARLARLSAGNPSVLRDIIRAAERTRLVPPSEADASVIPESVALRKIAETRLPTLDAPSRDALDLIALAEPARLAAVEKAIDGDVLVSLEARQLITARVGDTHAHLTVADPLLGHVLRRQMGPLRRRQLLTSWEAALPESERNPDEYVRMVGWEQQSGRVLPEERLLKACTLALGRHDLPTALHLARVTWRTYRSAGAADLFGRALLASASMDELHTLCREAAGKDDPHVARTLGYWQARAWILEGDYNKAEAAIPAIPGPTGELLAAMVDYFQGRYGSSLRRCSTLVSSPSPATRTEAAVFAMAALCHLGRPLDALALYEDAALAIRDEDDPWAPHTDSLEEMRAVALHLRGDLRGAQEILEREYRAATRTLSFRTPPQRGLALGFTQYERGLVRQALTHFVLTPAYQVGWQPWQVRARIYAELASLCLPDTRTGVADACLDSIPAGHHSAHLAIVRAHRALSRGDEPTALSVLRRAADDAVEEGAGTDVAIIVHEMARVGLASSTRAQWSVAVQGPYLQARLRYAQALTTDDHVLMETVACSFAAAGAELYAAEAYAEVSRMRRRAGDSGAAAAAVAAARARLGACDPVRTPALRFLEQPASLSRRERTMAVLAAQGWSDKEIAEQLILSPRTVSNTLHRVYQKFGIHGRRHLRQLLE